MYEKLKKEMQRQGISGNRLALKAQITPSDFYNAIRGDKPFYPKWRERIAAALSVKENEIFDDEKTDNKRTREDKEVNRRKTNERMADR